MRLVQLVWLMGRNMRILWDSLKARSAPCDSDRDVLCLV